MVELLVGHPAACDAVAGLLGYDTGWRLDGAGGSGSGHRSGDLTGSGSAEVAALLARHSATARAAAALLSGG